MKRLNKLLTASILAAGSIFLMSCQDVIFEEIRKEVKLEDAQIAGDVRSIVRYKESSSGKEYIYVQNGNLFKKCTDTKEDAETLHNWQKVSKPSGSGDIRFCNKLAADSSYLYAQIVTLKNDTDESEYVPRPFPLLSLSSLYIFIFISFGFIWATPAINKLVDLFT